ncbi:MAG: hypothetical protein KZQ57_11865, partial [gamma proteobacterium symbiont of Lucinoma myriamae]|nr:hypothetical protein [gamma proteobacterium symbiont of Lucinoma myriamae]
YLKKIMSHKTEQEIMKSWQRGFFRLNVNVCCATFNYKNEVIENIYFIYDKGGKPNIFNKAIIYEL